MIEANVGKKQYARNTNEIDLNSRLILIARSVPQISQEIISPVHHFPSDPATSRALCFPTALLRLLSRNFSLSSSCRFFLLPAVWAPVSWTPVFLCCCHKIAVQNIKFATLTTWLVSLSGINYIHNMRPLLLSISKSFSSSQTKTLFLLGSDSPFFSPRS